MYLLVSQKNQGSNSVTEFIVTIIGIILMAIAISWLTKRNK